MFLINKTMDDTSNDKVKNKDLRTDLDADGDIAADAAVFQGFELKRTGTPSTSTLVIHFDVEPGAAAKTAVDTIVAAHVGA